MLSAARIWAITLVAAYVAAITAVSFTTIRYEMVLDGMYDSLPSFTKWTYHAHKYTPLFVILSIPAILCAISDQLSDAQRRLAMTLSLIGLSMLAVWFGLIWLGVGIFVMKLESVI